MMRRAIPVLLLGLVLVPDWSAALGCPPIFRRPYAYSYPQSAPAVPNYAQAPVYPSYPPPRVTQERSTPLLAKPETARPDTAPNPRATNPGRSVIDPGPAVRPAEFVAPGSDSVPLAKPRPAVPDLTVQPPTGTPATSRPEIPVVPAPMGTGAAPKAEVPLVPAPAVSPEPVKPSTAKEMEGTKIPPLVPPLKGVPDPTVPPLAIPTPAVSESTTPKSTTSKSSPLAERPRTEIIPVDGKVTIGQSAKRKVGFFNQSERDVQLTVEGQTITLPKRHVVTAEVPVKFAWTLDGGTEQLTEIPTTSPGLEVVIRR